MLTNILCAFVEYPLLPKDPIERATVRGFCHSGIVLFWCGNPSRGASYSSFYIGSVTLLHFIGALLGPCRCYGHSTRDQPAHPQVCWRRQEGRVGKALYVRGIQRWEKSHQPPGKVDLGIFDPEGVDHSNIPSFFGPCGLSQKKINPPFSFDALANKNGGKEHNTLTMTSIFFDSILAVEAMLEKTAGTYSFGDSITMADLALVPQVYNGVR